MMRKNTPITKFRKGSAKRKSKHGESVKMTKPKSMGMMNTQPLNNYYNNFSNAQNYNRLFPDRNSAISLQIGGGAYHQNINQKKSRLSQKAKNRTGGTKIFGNLNNLESYNIRYNKYHEIYANNHNGPIKAIQK